MHRDLGSCMKIELGGNTWKKEMMLHVPIYSIELFGERERERERERGERERDY